MSHTSATPEQSAFIVRDARPSDSEAINRLCVEAYVEFRPTIGDANWQRLRETLSRASDLANEGELIVAEDSSGVLGIVLYIPPGDQRHRAPVCLVTNARSFTFASR